MKIFILVFFLSITPIELRLRNDDADDLYEIDDLLSKYDRHNYRPNKPYIPEETDDDDEYIPSPYQHKKTYPSHKKVLKENDDDDDDKLVLPKITEENELFNSSSCINGYTTKSEQLVKIKELKNSAHLIKYTLIDKRTLSSNHNIKDNCMIDCCKEKACDLAMVSEQATHEGYKCYLFDCQGSCPLAVHQDYTVLIPKKDSIYYSTSIQTTSITTISNVIISKKTSFFRETSVIIFLIFGIISTIVLFIFIFHHCRSSQKRGKKSKNYSVDADYLIDGLYL